MCACGSASAHDARAHHRTRLDGCARAEFLSPLPSLPRRRTCPGHSHAKSRVAGTFLHHQGRGARMSLQNLDVTKPDTRLAKEEAIALPAFIARVMALWDQGHDTQEVATTCSCSDSRLAISCV